VLAVIAVIGLAALNYRGITRTAQLTRILVVISLSALAVVVVGIAVGGRSDLDHLDPGAMLSAGPYGILQSAGLVFFAIAGYARIATLGEEVRDPQRTIPRAIPIALVITVAIYLIVAIAALAAAGPGLLASSPAPLNAAVRAAGAPGLAVAVRIGGAVASLGALLSLIAGVGRTSLAMARNRDLPSWLADVHSRFQVPHHAETAVAAVVCVAVALFDLRSVIGFSSFGVLVYYAIANASAFTQPPQDRRWPRSLNVLGAAGCLVLVATLPLVAVVAGLVMFGVGLGGRALVLARRRNDR
jgi:APA family basic amino acid/polyamine antiporter